MTSDTVMDTLDPHDWAAMRAPAHRLGLNITSPEPDMVFAAGSYHLGTNTWRRRARGYGGGLRHAGA